MSLAVLKVLRIFLIKKNKLKKIPQKIKIKIKISTLQNSPPKSMLVWICKCPQDYSDLHKA